MKDAVKRKIKKLRTNYAQIKEAPFDHFFCPILLKDEDVPLCQAHIINRAFRNSPRAWTIQRSDVDNFYGYNFESDFVALQYQIESWTPGDIITDKELFKQFRPTILVDNEPVNHFVAPNNVPKNYSQIEIENKGKSVKLGLKMSPENLIPIIDQNWEIEINKDLRLPALVSLIKAAHLTLFEMLGYSHALSAGGIFVARQILGKFFYHHNDKPKTEVLEAAPSFFQEFVNMVRPVQSCHLEIEGTITDNQFLVCRGNGPTCWALIVFIRTSSVLHAVMMPVFDQPDSVATFLNFLKNENESIEVNLCRFKQDRWEISKKTTTLVWPKNGILYP